MIQETSSPEDRVRANFVSGQLKDADALTYFKSLMTFTRTTMLLVESLIRATMPEGSFDGYAQRFLKSSQRAKYSGLSARLTVLKANGLKE